MEFSNSLKIFITIEILKFASLLGNNFSPRGVFRKYRLENVVFNDITLLYRALKYANNQTNR